MKRRRISQWHISRLRAAHDRSGSIVEAAKATGVSIPTAYRVLADRVKERGFRAPVQREALKLYASGLSCRAVSREMKKTHDPAPSQETIHQWAKSAGTLRDKSRADELQNARRTGRHYESLRVEARRLAEEHLWSLTRIAKHLQVSRNFVRRAVDPEYIDDASDATLKRAWSAMLPDVDRRRAVRDDVIARRERGEKLHAIVAATGKSLATVLKYLRDAGLTQAKYRPRRTAKRSERAA